MERYTDLRLLDPSGTVAKLPLPVLQPRAKVRKAPLSLPLSLPPATSLPFRAAQAQKPRDDEYALDDRNSGKELQLAAAGMERVMGLEPTTFSLGS